MRSVYTGCIQPYSTQFQSIISVYKLHKSISELSFDVWSQQTEMLFQCVGYFALQGMYYTVYLTLPSHISRLFHLWICRIWDCTWTFLGACHTWHFSWKDLGVSPGPNEVYIVSFQGRCLSLSICIYLQIRIYIYIFIYTDVFLLGGNEGEWTIMVSPTLQQARQAARRGQRRTSGCNICASCVS